MQEAGFVEVEAFEKNWRFSSAAMAGLKPYGIRTPATLTAFILQLVPTDGMQVGDYYEVDYQQVSLSIQVFPKLIKVDIAAGEAGSE
jgi:hypothetical protein